MKSFAFFAVALLALTAFAAQGRAQEDVEAQTFGIVKINTINNTITLAQLNAAVSKYAVYTSITAASIKNTGAAPTVTVNETANTITVTFRNNKPGVAFLTVSGAGNLTRTGSKLNKFSQNATTGIITGSVKVVSTKAKAPKAAEEDVDAQTFLYKVRTPSATNFTVTVDQMNASPLKAWALQTVNAVNRVTPRAAAAAVANNGTAIDITGVPANTKWVTVQFSGVVNINKWNKQNRTMVATPVNKTNLILKVTLTN